MRASTSFSIAEAAHADTFKHSFEYSSCLPRGVVVLSSVTEWRVNEQTIRSGPGDPGSVASEDIGARAAAWLGYRAALEAGFWRCSPGQRRLTLSSTAQTGAGRLDHGRVETDRKQSASQVLLALSLGKEAVTEGSRKLGAPLGRNHGRRAVGGGLTCVRNIGFTRYRCACDPFSGAGRWSGISTRNYSFTSTRRSRNCSPVDSIRPKRARLHCEPWMDSRNARRNAGTRGA